MRLSKWHGLSLGSLPASRARGAGTAQVTPERVRRLCDYHAGVGSGDDL